MARRWQIVDDARGQRVRPLGARRWPDDPAAARLSVQFVRLPAGGPAPGRAGVADAGLPRLRPVGQTPAAPLQPARSRPTSCRPSSPRRQSGPVVLVAHDMGTSVTTELLARDLQGRLPFELQRAVLSNGSVILHRASLRPVQKVAARPAGSARGTAVQQGEVQPGVRAPVQREPPAVGGGGRGAVGADRRTTTGTASRTC